MKPARHWRRWSAEDDGKLRRLWGTEGLDALSKVLGRTKITIYWRAQHLGLKLGVAQGSESLTTAAKRTGFSPGQLRRILKWARTPLHRWPTREPQRRKTEKRYHQVDSFDVDEAIKKWLATETLTSAARRHGVHGKTLAGWMEEAGHSLEKAPSHRGSREVDWKRLHTRVESALVDRVVAEREVAKEGTETLSDAAARIGVQRVTLRGWLLAAGVPREGYHWRVLTADVDRVAREHGRAA